MIPTNLIGEKSSRRKTAHHMYLVKVYYEIKHHGITEHNKTRRTISITFPLVVISGYHQRLVFLNSRLPVNDSSLITMFNSKD